MIRLWWRVCGWPFRVYQRGFCAGYEQAVRDLGGEL
jgi:hypothetical protein